MNLFYVQISRVFNFKLRLILGTLLNTYYDTQLRRKYVEEATVNNID